MVQRRLSPIISHPARRLLLVPPSMPRTTPSLMGETSMTPTMSTGESTGLRRQRESKARITTWALSDTASEARWMVRKSTVV